MNRSRIYLVLLALAAVASFYYAWQNTPRVRRAGEDGTAVRGKIESRTNQTTPNVRLDLSGGEQRKFSRPHRDLFAPLYPAPPAPPAPVPVKTSPKVVAPPPPPPPKPAPLPVVRQEINRMPAFKVLGFLAKSDRLTAFVALQGEIYVVKQGQQFAENYRVAELDRGKIVIRRIEGAGEVSLPLDEKIQNAMLPQGAGSTPVFRPPMRVARPPQNGVN